MTRSGPPQLDSLSPQALRAGVRSAPTGTAEAEPVGASPLGASGPAALGPATSGGRSRRRRHYVLARRRTRFPLGVIPLLGYLAIFLGLPGAAVIYTAFLSPEGHLTLSNFAIAASGTFRQGFVTSVELSGIVAVASAIFGLLIAMAIHRGRPNSILRRITMTVSAVFANFGGVPLAFIFIATLGAGGYGAELLARIGLNLSNTGFNLYGISGLSLVYIYFSAPLMVLVMMPGLTVLKPTQREAAHSLGASSWQYWRHVGMALLLPSVLGSLILLFGFAFSAYATAYALTSGTVPLTAMQIGAFVNGNVIAGQQNVGMALGAGMILVVGVMMVGYILLQRRAARWQ